MPYKRTWKACKKRWDAIQKSPSCPPDTLPKTKWSASDDNLLRQLYAQHASPTPEWNAIAREFNKRKDMQSNRTGK